jgi:hypothetical protein
MVGRSSDARIAMTAITTMSSMRVKAKEEAVDVESLLCMIKKNSGVEQGVNTDRSECGGNFAPKTDTAGDAVA